MPPVQQDPAAEVRRLLEQVRQELEAQGLVAPQDRSPASAEPDAAVRRQLAEVAGLLRDAGLLPPAG